MGRVYTHLSAEERERIAIGLAQGCSLRQMGRMLQRSNTTISREIERNRAQPYCGVVAHQTACQRRKLARRAHRLVQHGPGNALWCNVMRQLRRGLSPEQAACRLKTRHPTRPEFWVSQQTIYRAIDVLPRGELKRELLDCLRRKGRSCKPPHPSAERRRRWIEQRIAQRPPEALDRLTAGHWEGDLIIGQARSSQAVGVLYERSSRHIRLLKLERHDAWSTYRGFRQALRAVPPPFCRTLTYDQGSEMAEHRRLTAATGIQVFFCDPHSPWQRPGCENVNGLIREFLPKGQPLDDVGHAHLNRIAYMLNTRPRKVLNWRTPNEVWKAMVKGATFEQAINQPIMDDGGALDI